MSDRGEVPFRITPVVLQVLLSLSGGDAHAYGIMKDVEARTGGRVTLGPGSLHFTLTRLEEAGLIEDSPGPTHADPKDARRRYFRISVPGRRVLGSELAVWADAVELARTRDLLPDGRSGK